MSDQELYELLKALERGDKSTDHAYERIRLHLKHKISENRWFYLTSIAVAIIFTVFFVSCYQSA